MSKKSVEEALAWLKKNHKPCDKEDCLICNSYAPILELASRCLRLDELKPYKDTSDKVIFAVNIDEVKKFLEVDE